MRVKIAYVEQGDPWGLPVILLHGLTDSWRSFERVLPYLPTSLHAFALSQRGHGDSGRPAEGYAPSDFANDVLEFMDVLGLRRAVIVGHSLGAAVAQRFAIDHPDRTLGLVLVGAFSRFRGNAAFEALWNSELATIRDPVDPAFVREFQQSTLAQPVPQPFFEAVVEESLKVPARVWRAAGRGLLNDDLAAERERIRTPTLIVGAEKDAFVPRSDQEALASAIRGSLLVVFPDAGHAIHWEEPQRFARNLVAFLERPEICLPASRPHATRSAAVCR